MSDFGTFVLEHLPPPPRRVLEVGCGREGGVVVRLRDAGYDALGVDPEAPEAAHFVRGDYRDVDDTFDAVVAGRMLHHVHPLDEGVAKLARLAPLLLVDEFAWDRIDAAAQEWYEGQHRMLEAAGGNPPGPPSLDDWRARHAGLHPHDVVLSTLRTHFNERSLDWLPYLYHWLGGPSSESLEQTLVDVGAFPAIGYRWAGVTRASR